MAIWAPTDGTLVILKPSRIILIDGQSHAFGRLDQPGWPQFRLSSQALEVTDQEGSTHVRTRSRTYICKGRETAMPLGARAQMQEFLTVWQVPQDEWPAILSQLPED